MNYYNVYINNDTQTLSDDERRSIMSIYNEEKISKIKCARIKIEQKENVNLDFNDRMKVYIAGNPLETFMNISNILFLKYFNNVEKSENSCKIFLEITAEFSKTEEKENIYSYEDEYNTSNNMYIWIVTRGELPGNMHRFPLVT